MLSFYCTTQNPLLYYERWMSSLINRYWSTGYDDKYDLCQHGERRTMSMNLPALERERESMICLCHHLPSCSSNDMTVHGNITRQRFSNVKDWVLRRGEYSWWRMNVVVELPTMHLNALFTHFIATFGNNEDIQNGSFHYWTPHQYERNTWNIRTLMIVWGIKIVLWLWRVDRG